MTVRVEISLSQATAPAYSVDVPITVIDCETTLVWSTDPIADSNGNPADFSENPPFFNLVVSDIGVTDFTLDWTEDVANCGNTDLSFSATGTSDTDYISETGGVISFNLSNLSNRDVVTDTYVLPVTMTV